MDSKIILGRIIQRLVDQSYSQVEGYNRFDLVEVKSTSILVLRENGKNATIPLNKILIGIEAYQHNVEKYDKGPTELRTVGLTHITSPIFSMLHLLTKLDYSL
jgi:hypothetical protein